VAIDLFTCDLEVGDCLLLCSDGLWEMLRGDEIIMQHLQSQNSLAGIGQSLITAANDAGGEDNISVVLAKCMAT
jgi:protein phosphatase